MSAIETRDLHKRYGAHVALQGVDLDIPEGTVGLLGPNGAGKSTLIKALLGLIPFEGAAKVIGHDAAREQDQLRAFVGYMPEGDQLPPDLTAVQYILLAGELSGLPRSEARGRSHSLLDWVGLGEARYRKLGGFSTGMRQRVRLAQALAGSPKLLFLDEPTSGLDPRGREEMLDLIAEVRARTGATIILSTHILPDVERICDHVVVLAQGRVKHQGSLATLLADEENRYEIKVLGEDAALRASLEADGAAITDDVGRWIARLPEGRGAEWVLAKALEVDADVRQVSPLAMRLDDVFAQTVAGDAA